MIRITTYADIEELEKAGELSSAEKTLIANCEAGVPTVLEDGTLPEGPEDTRTVRAGLLRYLITGGCGRCEVHDCGVRLIGAYISGKLDLSHAPVKGATGLVNCRFEKGVEALQAPFELLNLSGSHLPGLNAQGVKVTGHVFLCEGFCAEGKVSLAGAKIGGQLSCVKGHFKNASGFALNAMGAVVTGDVFLQDGFRAEGTVNLSGAKIGGQLVCEKGQFNNPGWFALNAQKLVADALLWRDVAEVSGGVILDGAEIGDLNDDAESWGKVDELYMNGFTYQHIYGPTAVNMRLKWISSFQGDLSEFSSLPYIELANFYKKNGQRRNRIKTLIELEKQDRRADRCAKWYLPSGTDKTVITWPFMMLYIIFHWIFDAVYWAIGYGYRITNVFYILIFLLLPATYIFDQTYKAGDFAPNAAVILTTPEWQALAEDSSVDNPAKAWTDKTGKGRDYETFNAVAYAADVVIPIIPFGQEAAWAPSATRGDWGYTAWWARWVFQFAGWIVTALGAAAITGIMRKD